MIRAGVIGYGYWGPNIVRNFRSSGTIELVAVCDQMQKQRDLVKQAYPDLAVLGNIDDLLGDPSIDAVAIITPVASHFELGMKALRAGKHVWIEKPVTASSEEAKRLVDEADKRNLVLFVDHTFIYTGAVKKLRELCAGHDGGHPQTPGGELGKLVSYDSVRANLGLYRPDVNVLWDLAVHDVSIMDYALAPRVEAVSATGLGHIQGLPEGSAYMTCYLAGGAIAHVHADWFAPVKLRLTTIAGDRRMIVYDDNEAVEKLRVWDRGVDVTPSVDGRPPAVAYRQGPATAPELPKLEALTVAARHFAACIEAGTKPDTDGELGLRVVRILEAAIASMKGRGRPVTLG